MSYEHFALLKMSSEQAKMRIVQRVKQHCIRSKDSAISSYKQRADALQQHCEVSSVGVVFGGSWLSLYNAF